jgi:hypothetical protein
MTIAEQYESIRSLLKNGDLILVRGTGIIARIIRWADKSEYSHILVVIKSNGALFCVDSNANGVQADRLSYRIKSYKKDSRFIVLRPTIHDAYIETEMYNLLARSDNKWIRYDFKNGIKELCNRAFGWKLKVELDDNADICSDFVSRYAINLKMVSEKFINKTIVFPQDYIRYLDINNVVCIK